MENQSIQDIGHGVGVMEIAARPDDRVKILAFHGAGGGVDGSPDAFAPFGALVTRNPGVGMTLVDYRTQMRDQAVFDDMRKDAAHALDWAVATLPEETPLYLLGASFGALLVLDAILEADEQVRDKVAGLILLNPVTDIGTDGWSNRLVTAQAHSHLSPVARIAGHPLTARMQCFIAHGGQDEVVPVASAQTFAGLWPEGQCEMVTFPNSAHGFFNRSPHDKAVAQAVRTFVGVRARPEPEPAVARSASLIPDGATIVYGVGAQKAGTSWLFDCLGQSPDCHSGPTKEQHYFDTLYAKGEQGHLEHRLKLLRSAVEQVGDTLDGTSLKHLNHIQLLAGRLSIYAANKGDHRPYANYLFQGYRGQKIVCDFTPSYCALDAAGFKQMTTLGPSKFIFILRDPVDRMWSQVRMAISFGNPKLDDDAYDAKCVTHAQNLLDRRDLAKISRADYARTMAELEAAVPRTDIHYAFYENLFSQPSIDTICDFLGIDRFDIAQDKRVNLGRSTSLPPELGAQMAQALAPQYEAVRARFGADVPDTWRQGVQSAPTTPVGRISKKVVRLGNRIKGWQP